MSAAGIVADRWHAATQGTTVDKPLYIFAICAVFTVLWFNDFKSAKAYWLVVAVCIVALLLSAGLWGSSDSIIPQIGG